MLPKFDDGMIHDCQNLQVLSKFDDRMMCAYQILASATQVWWSGRMTHDQLQLSG